MTVREAVYQTLLVFHKDKQYSNISVSNAITKYSLSGRDRELYTRLVYGVLEKKLTLDYFIKQCSQKSVNRLDKSVAEILRLSVYQIKYCDKIPNSAAVSEGVKLAARYASRAKGFVNAVLRKAASSDIVYPSSDNLISYLSVKYSVSEDIASLICEQYPSQAEEILSAFEHAPDICFNVNTLKLSPDEFIEKYMLSAKRCPISPYGVRMIGKAPVSELDCFENGDAFVQDEASQIAALVLSPKKDMTVIDVCSCPGGKSFAAANIMLSDVDTDDNKPLSDMSDSHKKIGKILSLDIHDNKLSLVKKGADRLGFDLITTKCHNSTQILPELENTAHRVICDVPCSGLGVIAKKPDIRYKTIEEISSLYETQYKILNASAKYLNDGGILVYSACTINKKENEDIVTRFIENNPAFKLKDFSVGYTDKKLSSKGGMLTLLPSKDNDGFFIAAIERASQDLA